MPIDIPTAIAIGLGPTLAVVISAMLASQSARRAEQAQRNRDKDAELQRLQVQDVARKLAATATATESQLNKLQETATTTHVIVNNQRTEMVDLIKELRAEIAGLKLALRTAREP